MLFLKPLRNGITTKINNECTTRGEIIFIACPIGIRECMKHKWKVTIKNNTMVQSTTEIAEQPLNNIPMFNCWLVHELRQLADHISNVKASKRQVLKTTNNNAIFRRIRDD